jgi:hypothetical protein
MLAAMLILHTEHRPLSVKLALGAIAGQAIFVGGWIVVGALEGHGYSSARHDVSDLGALTAHHAGPWLAALAISGLLTMAFAVGALRPALSVPGQPGPIGAWLVALSLPALDNLGDVFFRLDCRAADAGCSSSDAAASWHGKLHIAVFLLALIPTLVAPFALSRRFRVVDGWHDLAGPAKVFGFVLIAGFVLTGALQGTAVQGAAQRVLILIVVAGLVALALRIRRLASSQNRNSRANSNR